MDELSPKSAQENEIELPQRKVKNKMKTAVPVPPSKKNSDLKKTGEVLGVSAQDFWKQSRKDISEMGFEKSHKNNKIVPIGDDGSRTDNVSRAGTAMERYNYDKQKGRDPAGQIAALSHKKLHSLRDEINDSNFSYFCSSQDKILDNSNSHPSFRIYFSFLKRFMIVAAICCLLAICLVIYNGTSDWYHGKDIKWQIDHISLGNIDGVDYQAEGSFLANGQKDNADKGLALTLSIDIIMTVLVMLFLVYQIDVSRVELRTKDSLYSVTDYAVRITNLPKKCPDNLERDIRNQFIRFGKIHEIVPLRNYSNSLSYEMKINEIADKIGDLKAVDGLKNTNSQKKIDDMVSRQQKYSNKQERLARSFSRTGHTKEYVVVFDSTKSKKECIEDYRQYSHWWSRPHSKMPSGKMLQEKYGFKIKDAPEPSEFLLENRSTHWIWKLLVFLFSIALVTGVCITALEFTLHDYDDKFDVIPLYTRCAKFDFTVVTTATYTDAVVAPERDEVYCYCRNVGKTTVEKDTGDLKSLCKNWLDSFDEYFYSTVRLVATMLLMNVFLTYIFKLTFHSRIFKIRNQTNRFLLTSICVLVSQFVFLGFLPEYWLDQTVHNLGREWYLRAAPIFALYFAWSLFLYPIETGVYWLVSFLNKKCKTSKAILQKDLDEAVVGQEYDYSHKIGRIMAHAYITFYHGAGIPILYVFFFLQLGIFILTEKALLLKFYKKFNNIEPYIRQYIIHSLLVMLFLHMFRTINILGSDEIFPDKIKETLGLKSGTLLYFYTADDVSYTGRLILPSGIAYLLFSIALGVFYGLIWWSHRSNGLGKILSWCALLDRPGTRAAKLSSIKPRNLVYYPNTYQFSSHYKYTESLPPIERKYVEASDVEARLSVPNMNKSSNLDSQYELKNNKSPRDGDDRKPDVAIKSASVFNIYSKKDPSNKAEENKQANDMIAENLEESSI